MCLAAGVSAASPAAAAEARERHFAIDLPAGPLARSLNLLATETGISVGTAGPLPNVPAPRVHGSMTAGEALRRLLAGTPLEAERIGPAAWRLVARRARPPAAIRAPVAAPVLRSPGQIVQPEIVVTGLRRPQSLFTTPLSVSVVDGEALAAGGAAAGSRDVAARVEGLTLTNLGQGRNRQFIRGVADSAFNGYSQSTVSIALDDARITYDAPDPDLRLVDIARVEVLKGPQGPLYGTGALGGVYRIVTNPPDPDRFSGAIDTGAMLVAHGGIGGSGSAILNLPLLNGRGALRTSLYAAEEPGWIDNANGRDDANRAHVLGGRLALRWKPAPGWTVDLAGTAQWTKVDDSQYVPLREESYRRSNVLPEPHDNDVRILGAVVTGRIGSLDFASTSSVTRHEVSSTLDASRAAASFGLTAPLTFRDDRHYRVGDQELRLSGRPSSAFSWTAGLSYLAARTVVVAGFPQQQLVALVRNVLEAAAYVEANAAITPRLKLETGLRVFSASTEDELTERSASASRIAERTIGLTPSIALSWQPDQGRFLYVRYAAATRPPGLAPSGNGAPQRFGSDRLQSYELGARLRGAGGRLEVTGALYHSVWHHVQSDLLLPDGLIATRNAGDAVVTGAEAGLKWRLSGRWALEAGATLQRARLVRGPDGTALPEDRRLPVAPDEAGRLSLSHAVTLAGWRGAAQLDVNLTGASRLSFDPNLDRRSGGYAVAGFALLLARQGWSAKLQLSNLLNSRADTFAFGNPFSIASGPQYTPLRPRSLLVSLGRTFPWKF